MRTRALATTLAALGAISACGTSSLDVLDPGADGGGSPATEGGVVLPVDAGTAADYCSGAGAIVLGAGATIACVGGLAQSAFRYALCTCDGLVSATSITTDSFDSANGPYAAGTARNGGGLGSNGYLAANGMLTVGGALWATDATGMTVATATAQGELHVGGRAASGPQLTVGADAYVLGDVAAQGNLSIQGALHQPSGAQVSAGGTKSIGATITGSFTVPPACDCDPALRVDVPAIVETYRAANDDAAAGIDPRALENVATDTTLTLPCGRLFFTRVGGSGGVHLVTSAGRTAIFVGGDLAPSGPFTIDVAPSNQVDVFVEGNVVAGSTFTVGDPAHPVDARLWIGGTGTANLQQATTFAGNLYAPQAELVLGGLPVDVYGSLFVRRLSAQAAVTIHYDEHVLSTAAACPVQTAACTSCHDCANQACTSGVCGACTDSSQCCAPLVCVAGTCAASLR
jgi:hypothetical protein